MANFTTYLANKLLGHLTGSSSYTMPTVYVALFTTNPTLPGSGAGGLDSAAEASYTGYARAATSGLWGAASAESIANSSAITFAACSGGTSTVIGFGLVDSSGSGTGNLLVAGTCSLSVSNGITPQFAASQLTVGIT